MVAITQCRACGSSRLLEFLDLGEQYLSDFREDDSSPPKYPIVAVMCDKCKLVQLKHTVPQEEMYHENYGFKSGISDSIKKDLDEIVRHAFQYNNDPRYWLDIASNDGTLLSFVPRDVFRVGIDPVSFLCAEAEQHADLIINDYFSPIYFQEEEAFDVITSISCFYDMPDPSQFVSDVKEVLAEKGVWIIQQNYLLTTMQLSAVDNFCHEHVEYYTMKSLENLLNRFDLEINEVVCTPINGGSIRTIVSRIGTFPVDESVQRQRSIEWSYNLEDIAAYKDFSDNVGLELNKLHRLIQDLKDQNNTIAILAASTRGSTIWQSADINKDLVDYAVERNPAKVGKMFSPIGIPIISEAKAHELNPNYMIVGPWFFASEIIDREKDYLDSGGHLILPLPEVRII